MKDRIKVIITDETIKSLKDTVNLDVKNVVDSVKNQKELLKNTADGLKNLIKF